MDHQDFFSRLKQLNVSFNTQNKIREKSDKAVIDFRIGDSNKWPDKFRVPRDKRDDVPNLVWNSSVVLEPEEEKTLLQDCIHVHADEAVIHLPPFRKDDKQLVQSYFSHNKDQFTIVYGQRKGFGFKEPSWGIIPHIYLNDSANASPQAVLKIIRESINLVENQEPITAKEILKEEEIL
jgi:hypothetical protein